ncbi:sporulation protein YtfJ [Orenia metallireducens]|jgi:sporulation protein YtfJ|uniref:Sporulation protein YtfJ n=1 Tax=Orenia metallireducens TaxID=1413210 RepID=A0A285HK19_9FIRM|nr:GerW family sporulation protein [Orenia metallireducens]PRX26671.1 sporulation protein YtfJ [Orenia metallireducens]SNY35994.1 sporulation protein YtfJ [Orenia metallireducens]
MADHPIENIMSTAMENIKTMVDVNTIVGDPVETKDGSVIIPVSKVNFGFAAGGAEYLLKKNNGEDKDRERNSAKGTNFGGGSGAGVMLQPIAFLVVSEGQVRLLPVNNNAVVERLVNLAPELLDHLKGLTKQNDKNKKEDNTNVEISV